MDHDVGNPPVPSALEMVLRRLSVVDGHPLGCSCPSCTRTGDAYRARADVVRAELAELEQNAAKALELGRERAA